MKDKIKIRVTVEYGYDHGKCHMFDMTFVICLI